MSPRERFPPNDPREWLGRAKSNLALARSRVPDADWEDLCFEAQQGAEKAIKAVLIHHDIEFPYVHDLARLMAPLELNAVRFPDIVRRGAELTDYAYSTRYPGAPTSVTEHQYQIALQISEAIVQWAEGIISGPRNG